MLLMFKIPSKCAENAAWGNVGRVKSGAAREDVGGEGGSRGVEERVINHVWVTHNEI